MYMIRYSYQLMWFCPVSEMNELVSGMSAPQFEVSARIRAGSSFKLLRPGTGTILPFLTFVLLIKSSRTALSSDLKAIPVTGRRGLYGCEMLRITHCLDNCLDNWLTVNCEILATCSSTYSSVRTSQEAHSVSIN
jgi:hypothetical protein